MIHLASYLALGLVFPLLAVGYSHTSHFFDPLPPHLSLKLAESIVAANLLRSTVPTNSSTDCPVVLPQDAPLERISKMMGFDEALPTAGRAADHTGDRALSFSAKTGRELRIIPRVIGGRFASPTLQNYVVALYSPGFKSLCTGTLLSPKWVLTAAHCGVTKRFVVTVGKAQAIPIGGPRSERKPKTYRVRRAISHPSFEPFPGAREYRFDIAVVEIEGGIMKRSQFMMLNDDATVPVDKGFVRTIGYGKTAFIGGRSGPKPYGLRQVDLPVMGQEGCQARYNTLSLPERIWPRTQICAGYIGRECDTCSGDSGGPLVRYGGADPILVGITSFGVRCGNPKFPSVFTRISGMVGWLKTTGAVFYTKKGVENEKSGLQCAAGEFVFEYRSGVEFCRPCPERSASRGGRVRSCELCERGMMRSSYNGAKCSCKGALAVGRGFVRGWCRRCGPGSFAAAADETCRMCAKGTVARGYGNGMCRAV